MDVNENCGLEKCLAPEDHLHQGGRIRDSKGNWGPEYEGTRPAIVGRPTYMLEDDDVVLSWWVGARSWNPDEVIKGRVRVIERTRRGPKVIEVDWTDGRTDRYVGPGMFTTYRRRGEVLDWEHLRVSKAAV